jgi:hypothetical protein
MTTDLDNEQDFEPDYAVKSWPWFFEQMICGQKKHDMRDKRDRDYAVGDIMLLEEFDPRGVGYTGRSATVLITYITDNVTPCAMSSSALDNDYAVLSVELLDLDLGYNE